MYWPGAATCSARPTICQVRLNTVLRSRSAMRSSVYQGPGMVKDWPRGLAGSKLEMISLSGRDIGIRVTENVITPPNCGEITSEEVFVGQYPSDSHWLGGGAVGPNPDGGCGFGQDHSRDFASPETRVAGCRSGLFSSAGKQREETPRSAPPQRPPGTVAL